MNAEHEIRSITLISKRAAISKYYLQVVCMHGTRLYLRNAIDSCSVYMQHYRYRTRCNVVMCYIKIKPYSAPDSKYLIIYIKYYTYTPTILYPTVCCESKGKMSLQFIFLFYTQINLYYVYTQLRVKGRLQCQIPIFLLFAL